MNTLKGTRKELVITIGIIFLGLIFLGLILLNFPLTANVISSCDLDATLINQDPYPAVPGDYVKLVFQLAGVENPSCGEISFELIENYPISFDPEDSPLVEIEGGTFERTYSSSLIVPYQVRIDDNAVDGANQIEVRFGEKESLQLETFDIEVESSIADFELHIDKYSYDTKDLTIEILNIAETDVEALTLEIPKQETISVRGTNRVVVGDLDSNEFTTADFKADIGDGEITIKVLYTDQTGVRRELTKTITFDSYYFLARDGDSQANLWYVLLVIVIGVAIWWFMFRKKKNPMKDRHLDNEKRRGMARIG